PAWKVLRVLGNVLELDGFEHTSSQDVLAELRSLCANVRPQEGRWSGGAQTGSDAEAEAAVYRIGMVPMYACDAVVRRAAALQRTNDAGFKGVALSTSVATQAGLGDGAQARIRCNGASVVATVSVDPAVPDGCLSLPSGIAETAALGPAYACVHIEPV
ncbi:MAG: NADH-quinone oxidoreductase subunit NuoG, partial [Gammaproteobacteria bacterium]